MGRHSAEVTQLSEKQVDFDISPFRRNRSIARSASICALQKNRGYGIWEVKVRPTCIDALREPRAENREPRTHHENMKTQQLKSGWSNDDVVFTDEANCGAIRALFFRRRFVVLTLGKQEAQFNSERRGQVKNS